MHSTPAELVFILGTSDRGIKVGKHPLSELSWQRQYKAMESPGMTLSVVAFGQPRGQESTILFSMGMDTL